MSELFKTVMGETYYQPEAIEVEVLAYGEDGVASVIKVREEENK